MKAISPGKIVLLTVLLTALGMGLAAVSRFGTHGTPNGTVAGNALAVPSDIGGDFELTGPGSTRVRLTDYRGKLVVLFFGYTYCPDVCPTALLTLGHALNKMPEEDAKRIQVFMISVDPERDTVKKLDAFVKYFDPRFIGLTGTNKEIARVAKKYLAYYEKESGTTNNNYLVGHSAFIYLLDGQGKVRTMFRRQSTSEEIAMELRNKLKTL